MHRASSEWPINSENTKEKEAPTIIRLGERFFNPRALFMPLSLLFFRSSCDFFKVNFQIFTT